MGKYKDESWTRLRVLQKPPAVSPAALFSYTEPFVMLQRHKL